MLKRCLSMALILTAAFGLNVRAENTEPHIVLTSLQATYSIASAISTGTRIKIMNVPAQGSIMDSQTHALARVPDETFKQAEAVITIARLWRDDPLYPAARARNLRIVNIDASFPWSSGEPGVAVIRQPLNDVPWVPRDNAADPGLSRFVWLSPTNAIRMAELIATDLARLSPEDAARVRSNEYALADQLRKLKAEYGGKYARLPDPRVFSLADEFVYLFGDLGVFVDGWFVKQDVNWTDSDYSALTAYLREHQLHTVVHKWTPNEKVLAAIKKADAQLVVLDAADPGPVDTATNSLLVDGYLNLMRRNMDVLLQALGDKSSRK